MDEFKKNRLNGLFERAVAVHDELVELVNGEKKSSEEKELLCDALDSFEEALSCMDQVLDPK